MGQHYKYPLFNLLTEEIGTLSTCLRSNSPVSHPTDATLPSFHFNYQKCEHIETKHLSCTGHREHNQADNLLLKRKKKQKGKVSYCSRGVQKNTLS